MIFDLKTNKNLTIKVLQIIYDMLPSFYPQYFVPGMTIQFNTYMQKMLGICDEVFTISQSTKSDIIKFQATHNLPKITVDVFRLGEDFVRHDPIKPSFDLKPNKFILCVGTIESRKNHILLYYAMKDATTRNISIPPIIVVGKRGWLADNLFYIVENDPIMSKKLLFINNATDQELSWLFQNCLLTVYPSFCEGWGLPIAESLYYGKHCLSSNSSSMPEIAGDLIDYFSPYDPVAMLGLITTYTNKPTLLEQKELDIQKNYKPTSWDETFLNIEQVVNTYVV
jgi:glycosyltransferase involved in cell wall biosynthesis